MYGNGVMTGMEDMAVEQRPILWGRLPVLPGSIVVVAGTTLRLSVVLPFATTAPRPIVTSILASASFWKNGAEQSFSKANEQKNKL